MMKEKITVEISRKALFRGISLVLFMVLFSIALYLYLRLGHLFAGAGSHLLWTAGLCAVYMGMVLLHTKGSLNIKPTVFLGVYGAYMLLLLFLFCVNAVQNTMGIEKVASLFLSPVLGSMKVSNLFACAMLVVGVYICICLCLLLFSKRAVLWKHIQAVMLISMLISLRRMWEWTNMSQLTWGLQMVGPLLLPLFMGAGLLIIYLGISFVIKKSSLKLRKRIP